ncbi:MAG: methyltransferase domain-containing protein, partial [Opitutus sp.]
MNANLWDERYSAANYAYGTEPNEFVAAMAAHIPAGPVLCLAEGEGRNAVFLAKCGHPVTAVDASPVGLGKARALAQARGVTIATIAADLAHYAIVPGM